MQNFRKMNFRVLIATDIAARGLDVPHIEHVINYDLPQVAEDYIHRMGRTARAGAEGSAISFVSQQDGRKWHAIEMLLDPQAANDKGARGPKGAGRNFKRQRNRRPNGNGKPSGKPQGRSYGKPNANKPGGQTHGRTNAKPGGKKSFSSGKRKAA